MQNSRFLGFVAFVILVVALASVLSRDPAPALSIEALRESPPISTTTTEIARTTTIADDHPVLEPDVDALGRQISDLGTTTSTTEAPPQSAPQSANPSTNDTQAPKASSTTTTTTTPPVEEGGPNGEFEGHFASKINGLRSGTGLEELKRDGSLDARARAWAEKMADRGSLAHSDLGSLLPPWSAAAENVGMGASVETVFGALADSSGHKANMLGPYTHVGIGVWVDSSGIIWTAHVFAG